MYSTDFFNLDLKKGKTEKQLLSDAWNFLNLNFILLPID